MLIDRSRFLALAATLAGCAPTTPANTPEPGGAASAPTTSEPTSAPTSAPTATAPTSAPTPSAPAPTPVSSVDELAACDSDWAFGPCGEGGFLQETCRNDGESVEPAGRAGYLACIKSALPKVMEKAGGCAGAATKCGKARAECEAMQRKARACHQRVESECATSPAVVAETNCWMECVKAAKPGSVEGIKACQAKCGEPDTAKPKCVAARVAAECKPLDEKSSTCFAASEPSCKLPAGCEKSVAAACSAGWAALGKCKS